MLNFEAPAIDFPWRRFGGRYWLSGVFADAHLSSAAYTGYLPLANNFAWLGTASALTKLGVAAVVETICSTA
jgi:hypothetical protein